MGTEAPAGQDPSVLDPTIRPACIALLVPAGSSGVTRILANEKESKIFNFYGPGIFFSIGIRCFLGVLILPSPLWPESIQRENEVSETKQSLELPRSAQPLGSMQAAQTSEVVVDDSGSQPLYSNFCRVTATPEEVILDFGLNTQPFAAGRQDVKVAERIVMNLYTAKRLLTAIGMTIQRHEQTFGAIELDVRHRLRSPQS